MAVIRTLWWRFVNVTKMLHIIALVYNRLSDYDSCLAYRTQDLAIMNFTLMVCLITANVITLFAEWGNCEFCKWKRSRHLIALIDRLHGVLCPSREYLDVTSYMWGDDKNVLLWYWAHGNNVHGRLFNVPNMYEY